MRSVTKKWILLKISSLILIPLMFWFIVNFVSIYDNDYQSIVGFLTSQSSKFLISLFLIFSYFFSSLSISEVFEDYIHNEKNQKCRKQSFDYFCYKHSFIYNNCNI